MNEPNHDSRHDSGSPEPDAFRSWLERETVNGLRRSRGNDEAVRGVVFLFVNRAYEARLPETEIGAMFGKCLVQAGYSLEEEPVLLDWLEHFAEIATRVQGGSAPGQE